MPRDTEETQRRLRSAAAELFAERGREGTTVDEIARRAGVNRERLYAYFGDKDGLFGVILGDELARLAAAVPLADLKSEGVGEFAGRLFDYHLEQPRLQRLLQWEGLTLAADPVPDEVARTASYQEKVAVFARAQGDGELDADIGAADLLFLTIAIAAWWAAVPQLARMVEGDAAGKRSSGRRRETVVRAAERLALAPPKWRP